LLTLEYLVSCKNDYTRSVNLKHFFQVQNTGPSTQRPGPLQYRQQQQQKQQQQQQKQQQNVTNSAVKSSKATDDKGKFK
jgi:hypothetical protein